MPRHRRDHAENPLSRTEPCPAAFPGSLVFPSIYDACLVKQSRLGRRPALWQLGLPIRRLFRGEKFQNLPDHDRIFDAGNDPDRPLALLAGFNVDIEHPFQALGPGHGGMALGWYLVVRVGFVPGLAAALAPPGGRDQCAMLAVGANTPWKRVRLTLGFGTKAASLARKSKGSKIAWVVPLRNGVFNS